MSLCPPNYLNFSIEKNRSFFAVYAKLLNLSSGSSSTAYTFNGYALARAVAEPPPGLPGRVPGLAASTVYRLECLVVRLGS
jgi:hypothetical protein